MSKNEERLNEDRGFSESITTKTEQNKANTRERHHIYKTKGPENTSSRHCLWIVN